MAYSSISHAAFMLMVILANVKAIYRLMLFYITHLLIQLDPLRLSVFCITLRATAMKISLHLTV
ncbi:MAG: hypothetical protein IPM51_15480 [Sphingobacteriaceae bacterium]|nr:hypothetical protein [Sphingobacteriaceae bacterium]